MLTFGERLNVSKVEKIIGAADWQQPAENRPFYIDLEFEGRIYVSKELYKEYMRPERNEWKKSDRESRCMVPGVHGKLKKCSKKCSECAHFRNNYSVSIEYLHDQYELEIEDRDSNVVKNLINDETMIAVRTAIESLNPIEKTIIKKTFYDDLSQEEIGKILGMSQRLVSYHLKKAKDALYEQLKDYAK